MGTIKEIRKYNEKLSKHVKTRSWFRWRWSCWMAQM